MQETRTTRAELDGEQVEAVQITDPDAGCTYVVVVEMENGVPHLRYMTVRPDRGAQPPAQFPWKILTVVAAKHLGLVRERQTPEPEEVAQIAREAANQGRSVRQHVARTFEVSVHTADTWLRKARDRGLIGKSNAGRPRKGESK